MLLGLGLRHPFWPTDWGGSPSSLFCISVAVASRRLNYHRGSLANIDALALVCPISCVSSLRKSIMKVGISVDVPSIDEGLKFFREAFGFVEFSRPHPGYAMLSAGEAIIGLLAKPAGSSPAEGSSDVRRYERHWTPVHIDFRVEEFEASLTKALQAGAKSEQVHRVCGYPPVAFCSDPFGHGFCIVGLHKL
jgi:predicted enzyme related to lactoylglutathione lyase